MIYLIFGLISITAPIFWLIGVITFLKAVFGSKKTDGMSRAEILKSIIPELKQAVGNKKSLENLLKKYETEASGIISIPAPLPPTSTTETANRLVATSELKPEKKEEVNIEKWWERWYAENTINFFLYVGAFLIVMSASIFVGLQWESLSGSAKSIFFNLFTVAFFVSGLYFYFLTPKLRNAGATFLAIGAILLPFNGLAWYNFVLKEAGTSFSSVWLVTSLISLVIYGFLASFVRNKFYTYIAGLGGLSFIESFVAVGKLPLDYYVLGGIFSSFVFVGSAKLFNKESKEQKDTYYEPLYLSAQVVMPISLIIGLLLAASQDKLFTSTTAIAALMASGFYYFSYLLSQEVNFLVIGQVLTSVTVGLGSKALGFTNTTTSYLVLVSSFAHAGGSLAFNSIKKVKEADQSLIISLYTGTIIIILSIIFHLTSEGHLAVLTFFLSLLYLFASWFSKNPVYLHGLWGFLGLSLYFAFSTTPFADRQFLFAYVLSLAGAVFFSSAVYFWQTNKRLAEPFLIATVFYFVVAYFFALPDSTSLLVVNFALSGISLGAALFFKQPQLLHGFWLFFGLGIFITYSSELNLNDKLQYFSLILMLVATLFYAAAVFLWKKRKDYAATLLVGTIVYIAFAHAFSLEQPNLFLIVNSTTAALALAATYFFQEYRLTYLANFFMYLSLWTLLRLIDVPLSLYPFWFGAGSLAFYFSYFLPMEDEYKKAAKNTGLIMIAVTSLIFAYISRSYGSYTFYDASLVNSLHFLERNSLIISWIAGVIYLFEALMNRDYRFNYLASAYLLGTFLWQEKFLGIDELQFYTVPIAVYFLVLSYVQKERKDLKDLFEGVGLFVLLAPTFLQTFGTGGGKYNFILGIQGTILIFLGTTIGRRNLMYTGAAAVFLAVFVQLIKFVSNLPAWITIGSGGLIFLGVAIYLLSTRKTGS